MWAYRGPNKFGVLQPRSLRLRTVLTKTRIVCGCVTALNSVSLIGVARHGALGHVPLDYVLLGLFITRPSSLGERGMIETTEIGFYEGEANIAAAAGGMVEFNVPLDTVAYRSFR